MKLIVLIIILSIVGFIVTVLRRMTVGDCSYCGEPKKTSRDGFCAKCGRSFHRN